MKKTIIALMALAGIATAEDAVFTTLPSASKVTSSFSTYGFAFNLSGSALTTTAVPTDAVLPDEVSLTSMSWVLRQEGNGTEVKKNGLFYIVITDMSNQILGWSNEKSSNPTSTNAFVWTFNSITLDTDTNYKAIAYDDVTGLTVGSVLTKQEKFMEWGTNGVADYRNDGNLSFDGSVTGAKTGLQVLSSTSYDAFGSNQYAPNLTIKTAPIPEPTTATLSLLALAGLAARRRRK